jgi:hypothetical protein
LRRFARHVVDASEARDKFPQAFETNPAPFGDGDELPVELDPTSCSIPKAHSDVADDLA